jgi:hypothetical protein
VGFAHIGGRRTYQPSLELILVTMSSSSQSGYNTITQNGFAPNEVDAEGAALLRKPSHQQDAKAPLTARLHDHFTANISKSWADIALLGCYIITGLLDSSSVFIWGSFVSMQTGKQS